MRAWGIVWRVVLTFFLVAGTKAEAFILINEILADPPAGIGGDANGDGVGSTSQDEFVELFNNSDNAVDITGYYLSDALKNRHVFAQNSVLAARGIIVVFGGGSPQLIDISWQTASEGSLGLNNAGDTVTLYNPADEIIDQVVYESEGGHDQSLTRFPEGEGEAFVQHLSLPGANGRRFSPGYFVNPPAADPEPVPPVSESTAAPEPATLALLTAGVAALFLRRKNNRSLTTTQ